jgi:peptidoglycan/xylan/chitin deacetylase (PgdA/CDA1 family)
MDLLVLMYHRAQAGAYGNSAEMLDQHFRYIREHYAVLLPGENGDPGRLNVCLTFDDAYFDFYATVFPLLQKHGLRAVLGVPVACVMETVNVPAANRLAVPHDRAFGAPALGAFCTWPELEQLARSGHVAIAAHGYTHVRLDRGNANLGVEIDTPATLLRARLRQPVDSFIFPYGRYSAEALDHAADQYRYVFRIGGALNRGWNTRPLYRVDADQMVSADARFASRTLALYRARRWWNRLRGR